MEPTSSEKAAISAEKLTALGACWVNHELSLQSWQESFLGQLNRSIWPPQVAEGDEHLQAQADVKIMGLTWVSAGAAAVRGFLKAFWTQLWPGP